MRVIRGITLSCAMLLLPLIAASCGAREAGERVSAPSASRSKTKGDGTWSSTQGVTFRPPVPTQPSTRVATTQRPRRTLDQVLHDVSPTPEQRSAVARMLEQAQREWVAWLNQNRAAREQVLAENAAAAAARDRERLEQAQARSTEIMKTIPRPATIWKNVRGVFPPQRQPALEPLELEARAAISEAMHVAVRPAIPAADRGTTRACMICHLPYYEVKP